MENVGDKGVILTSMSGEKHKRRIHNALGAIRTEK